MKVIIGGVVLLIALMIASGFMGKLFGGKNRQKNKKHWKANKESFSMFLIFYRFKTLEKT